tara:strand:+ start:257 stop:430 length:174 start_codon:yes stop_codon:yes gene_type:complete
MLDNFEPQEKKAIIIFIALLALGLVYVGTHEFQWEKSRENFKSTPPVEEASNSGRFL